MTSGTTDQLDPSAVVETAPSCEVCPHPVADHDAISNRFCQVTQVRALTRGCVCRPAA